MKVNSFWLVILKIISFYFLGRIGNMFSSVISSIIFLSEQNEMDNYNLLITIFHLFILLFFIVLFYIFLFKTQFLINKLNLNLGFENENFTFNLNLKLILKVIIILFGGLMLIDSIPYFFTDVYRYFKNAKRNEVEGISFPDLYAIIFYFSKMIIGFLLVKYNKIIVRLVINFSDDKKVV